MRQRCFESGTRCRGEELRQLRIASRAPNLVKLENTATPKRLPISERLIGNHSFVCCTEPSMTCACKTSKFTFQSARTGRRHKLDFCSAEPVSQQ